jgi:hypothetical protein
VQLSRLSTRFLAPAEDGSAAFLRRCYHTEILKTDGGVMKQDARRNRRRRKYQKIRLARREYFGKKKEAPAEQATPALVSSEAGSR